MTTKEIQEYLLNPDTPGLRYFPFQVAQELSDLAAVLLYDIYSRTKNKKSAKNDGFVWTYDSLEVFASNHPYASESGVRKAFLALEEAKLIRIEKTGKYNGRQYDEKWWYALTEKGKVRAAKWLMRFLPDVAASVDETKENEAVLGIPTAVILENFRYQLHEAGGDGYVIMKPSELKIPYSTKTIGRHLDGLVENEILERDLEDKHRYCVAADVADQLDQPLTVPPSKLLPPIKIGDVALLTAPSGTAKTSFGTFLAVQHAVAGENVIYVTLEEPSINIVHRMYAGEYGVSYSDLHQGKVDASDDVKTKLNVSADRTRTIATHLRVLDLSEEKPTAERILEKIGELQRDGFAPGMVVIDQLEFSSAGDENEPDENVVSATDVESEREYVGRDVPLALAMSKAFRGQPYKTVVLHQVDSSPRPDFAIKNIAGGQPVTDCFDIVLGIGRTNYDDRGSRVELRVFSLTPTVPFDSFFDADFAHMRFKPKK